MDVRVRTELSGEKLLGQADIPHTRHLQQVFGQEAPHAARFRPLLRRIALSFSGRRCPLHAGAPVTLQLFELYLENPSNFILGGKHFS